MKRYIMPEQLINDERVNAKLLGMYVVLLANTYDGKHVNKTAIELSEQLNIGTDTYYKYRNKLEELGYLSVNHNAFMGPSVITLKGDNGMFKPADFDDVIDAEYLADDESPLKAFRSLFDVEIPKADLKRIERLNIPNNLMRYALDNVYYHEEHYQYTDYSKMLNYAIKIAQDYEKHGVKSRQDVLKYENQCSKFK